MWTELWLIEILCCNRSILENPIKKATNRAQPNRIQLKRHEKTYIYVQNTQENTCLVYQKKIKHQKHRREIKSWQFQLKSPLRSTNVMRGSMLIVRSNWRKLEYEACHFKWGWFMYSKDQENRHSLFTRQK